MAVEKSADAATTAENDYQVVARRYRPQTFESLIGQGQISTALANAIKTNRVGHAYLFTGARGVGKTTAARIFSKCLNCEKGPTATPCDQCDNCRAISEGQDVDVMEIDGASNRGIDEIRDLRAKINVRPSRSIFKIYIVDEVHMLTKEAFNALLKTLEEPPAHAKFIFCTTDPEQMPITVLSRCQRFDFAPVDQNSISKRLTEICAAEGFEAEPEAVQLLARLANGSMRDSQSLLEQLLAFCETKITLDDVNQMTGNADLGRIKQIVEAIISRDAGAALAGVAEAIGEGVDVYQMATQLLGLFRDLLIVGKGCGKELLLTANPSDFQWVQEQSEQLGAETAYTCLQIIDKALTRFKFNPNARVLLEMAVVRCCELENLDAVAGFIEQVRRGGPIGVLPDSGRPKTTSAEGPTRVAAKPIDETKAVSPAPARPAKKKEAEPVAESPTVPSGNRIEIHPGNMDTIWKQTLEQIEDIASDYAGHYESLAISAPNCLAVTLDSFYKEKCEVPTIRSKLENKIAEITNQKIRIDFVAATNVRKVDKKPKLSKRQQMKAAEQNPYVRGAIETFDGEITEIRNAKR